MNLTLKYRKLKDFIRSCGSAVVAFSGGVDSSVLASVAHNVLGVKAVAVTLDSQTMPRSELAFAGKLARRIGIRHVVLNHDELKDEDFKKNDRNRCYYCKRLLARMLRHYAREHEFSCVLEGTNASEVKGHRPGFKALQKAGVASPLAIAGFTKEEVRSLARALKLPNSEKPSMACLSSRIPYGTPVTAHDLLRIEKAEEYLKKRGIQQVRVRCFDRLAVIEVLPEEFSKIYASTIGISRAFMQFGFSRVALDLHGYRTGSMNQAIREPLHTLRSRPSHTRRRGSR
jgi:uncharacterized protein